MPAGSSPRIEPLILVVLVLYKRAPTESESLRSFLQVLAEHSLLARHFSLILYDNSPAPHDVASALEIPVHYRHDPANGGLAAAYNYALDHAANTRHEWLLLLDQDTSLTYDFVSELIACVVAMGPQSGVAPSVASIVPKLLVDGKIHSPAAHFIDQLRHQYKRARHHAVSRDLAGVQPGRLGAYNSGATLRVSALLAIGGFPKEYWLDYLDHAVFHALSVHGFSMYVMKAVLLHDFAQSNQDSVPAWRRQNILLAQTRFVKQTGNFFDRLLYRLQLFRSSGKLLIAYPGKRLWREPALQAFLLTETSKAGNKNKV